jgi:hypothetical protein
MDRLRSLFFWMAALDPALTWDERLSRWANIATIAGPVVTLAAGIVSGWLLNNAWIGLVVGLVLWNLAVNGLVALGRRAAPATESTTSTRVQANNGPSPTPPETEPEEVEQLRTQLVEKDQRIDELQQQLAANRPPRHHDIAATLEDTLTPAKAGEIEEEKRELNTKIKELEAKLAEAEQEIERLRIEINNRPPRHFNTPIEVVETLTPAKAKEIEVLKAENERLQKQVGLLELSKQKRLCFHLADDLRALYESFQQDERVLLAQLQKQKSAGATKEEFEEERRTKQAEIEKRAVNKYHNGYPDRLEKLYEELESQSWLGPNDEDLFLNVTIPLDILRVADRLKDVGSKL